jgi:hypothetical protein
LGGAWREGGLGPRGESITPTILAAIPAVWSAQDGIAAKIAAARGHIFFQQIAFLLKISAGIGLVGLKICK